MQFMGILKQKHKHMNKELNGQFISQNKILQNYQA